jgi:hypothetical protein
VEQETIDKFKEHKLFPEDRGQQLLLHARERIVTEYCVSWAVGIKNIRIIDGLDGENSKIVGMEEYPLLNDLSEIDGVIQLTIAPFVIAVYKGNAFEWDELASPIIEAWKTFQWRKDMQP